MVFSDVGFLGGDGARGQAWCCLLWIPVPALALALARMTFLCEDDDGKSAGMDDVNWRLRSIREDKGICSTDHHMTGMSCAERHMDVLERVGGAGPLSDLCRAAK